MNPHPNNKYQSKINYLCISMIAIIILFTSCSEKNETINNNIANAEITTNNDSNRKPTSSLYNNVPSEESSNGNSKERELYGNTMSNIANEGFAAEYDGWIYYGDHDGLYRMNMDGTEISKLSDNLVSFINVWDGWVYYTNDYPGNGEIYRTSIDGTKTEKINDEVSYSVIVNNDWIYYVTVNYVNEKIEYKIKKISLDGSKEIVLIYEKGISKLAEPTHMLYLYNGWIYYINMKDSNKFYKITKDGTQKTKVSDIVTSNEHAISFFLIEKDWIYYLLWDNIDNRLYRMKTDGTSQELVVDCSVGDFNVTNDYIIFTDASEYLRTLYRVKVDGTEKTKISDMSLAYINLIGDYLYCCDSEYDSTFYKIDMNGNIIE